MPNTIIVDQETVLDRVITTRSSRKLAEFSGRPPPCMAGVVAGRRILLTGPIGNHSGLVGDVMRPPVATVPMRPR